MLTLLIPPGGEAIPIPAAPRTRYEALGQIASYAENPITVGTYRIVTIDVLDVSPDESCDVEDFAVGLRHYGDGAWGLVEASASANHLPAAGFSPIKDDLILWLKALRHCWQTSAADFTWTLEQVDDFHVLQLCGGSSSLTSLTVNAEDIFTHFSLPKMLDNERRQWGDAVVADIGLVYKAVEALNLRLTANIDGLGFGAV